jgi:hypothetical protein
MVSYLKKIEGTIPVNKSMPIRRGMEIGAEIVRRNHPELTFSLPEAVEFLSSIGMNLSSLRSARTIVHQLQDIELISQPSAPPVQPSAPQECIQSEEDICLANERRKREEAELKKAFSQIAGIDMED